MYTERMFTGEARRLLREEQEKLVLDLEKEAIGEALRTRGEPVEVTASDVRKARQMFTKREPSLRPVSDLLLRVYTVLGVLMFVIGIMYPFFKEMLIKYDTVSRISFMISLAGLALAVFSMFMRKYFDALHMTRMRRRLEEQEMHVNIINQQEGASDNE